jgi:acetyltransferase-like isoleucine patch superfamily enzyme
MIDDIAPPVGREEAAKTQPVPASSLKRLAKTAARAIAALCVFPFYMSYVMRRAVFGDQAFRSSSQLLSLVPGHVGDYLRGEFYRLTVAAFGADVQVCFGALFSSAAASVGDRVYIGSDCVIGNVDIGSDVLLGSNVHLLSGQRQHGIADLEMPIRLQGGEFSRIQIGCDTWIGNGALVMANVGRQCVVGAGSVVVSDLPDRSVAAGNPARVLKTRGQAAP